ncbi:MAG: hypothetical protein H0W44_10735 [Gammaproteobacteria bacterium]|nr:hypothetical protein [Gammaproteobacteria bacterium]
MVELAIKEVAKKWDLRIYEKDREQMKFHTQGKEAFFIVLYFNKDPVLSLDNSGVGEVITLMAVDYGNMPIQDLKKLAYDVIDTFETRFDIKFEKN